MKLFVIIFLSLMSITENSCHKKFELIKATSQEWHAGREEAGYGTYYELTIVTGENSDNLIFDKMWVGKDFFEVQTFQKGKKMRNNLFSKGDTVTIRVNKATRIKPMPFVIKDEGKEESNIKNKNLPPKDYDGAALLSYVYKGKRKYFEIKEFIKIDPLYYP